MEMDESGRIVRIYFSSWYLLIIHHGSQHLAKVMDSSIIVCNALMCVFLFWESTLILAQKRPFRKSICTVPKCRPKEAAQHRTDYPKNPSKKLSCCLDMHPIWEERNIYICIQIPCHDNKNEQYMIYPYTHMVLLHLYFPTKSQEILWNPIKCSQNPTKIHPFPAAITIIYMVLPLFSWSISA